MYHFDVSDSRIMKWIGVGWFFIAESKETARDGVIKATRLAEVVCHC